MNVILPVSVLKCALKWMDEYPMLPHDKVTLSILDPELLKIGGHYKITFSDEKKFIKIETNYEKLPAE